MPAKIYENSQSTLSRVLSHAEMKPTPHVTHWKHNVIRYASYETILASIFAVHRLVQRPQVVLRAEPTAELSFSPGRVYPPSQFRY